MYQHLQAVLLSGGIQDLQIVCDMTPKVPMDEMHVCKELVYLLTLHLEPLAN